MSLQTFGRALDFLERSEIEQLRLLGGEPTLHPEFPIFIKQALDRNFRVLVFSNGYMPKTALDCLQKVPSDRVNVLVNLSSSETFSPPSQRLIAVFQRLTDRIIPGINIDSPAIQFDGLIELIDRYQLSRTIRLGLAHPIVTGENHFLHPRYYATVGQKILVFAERANKTGIALELDCGFVPCMFSPDALDSLGTAADDIGQRCNPILDILPDGQVISCYPLSSLHQESLPEQHDASWLREQFEQRFAPYRRFGIFRECAACLLRANGSCTGGCLSAAMQRLRYESFTFTLHDTKSDNSSPKSLYVEEDKTLHEKASEPARWSIPYIDRPLSFWKNLAAEYAENIGDVYCPFPENSIGSGRPSQPAIYFEEFFRQAPLDVSVLINPIIITQAVEEIAPKVVETLRQLHGDFGIQRATISNLQLAAHIHNVLPEIILTASVLMDISQPNQVVMLLDIFETLVPSSRIMRDFPALKALREAFPGRIKLLVNEGCLPGCPLRTQHFYEMGRNQREYPRSLCESLLQGFPWMRLTGAWVLPQHLHLYDGLYDELKLAGRVTLRDSDEYLKVLDAYLRRTSLFPNEIGGGPASVLDPVKISEDFFKQTLYCGHQCYRCSTCQEYWRSLGNA